MNRLISIFLIFPACGGPELITISGPKIERKLDSDRGPIKRGEGQLGAPCAVDVDCAGLYCLEGICAQACTAAACPLGSVCAPIVLEQSCEENADCAIDVCAARGCTCEQVTGERRCTIAPHCYSACDLTGGCEGELSCASFEALSLSICLPSAFSEPTPVPDPQGEGELGDPCGCRSGLICENSANYPNGYCTKDCSAEPCPGGAACVVTSEEGALHYRCRAVCNQASSCAAPGAQCTDDGEGGALCI